MRRFTRLTNAFSKLSNHEAAVALHGPARRRDRAAWQPARHGPHRARQAHQARRIRLAYHLRG